MVREGLGVGYFTMMHLRAGLRTTAKGGVYPFLTPRALLKCNAYVFECLWHCTRACL